MGVFLFKKPIFKRKWVRVKGGGEKASRSARHQAANVSSCFSWHGPGSR